MSLSETIRASRFLSVTTFRAPALLVLIIGMLASAFAQNESKPATAAKITALPGAIGSFEGLRLTLSLASEVSSKLPTGTSFRALLEEPAAKDGQAVLPKGTVFEGHLKTVRARRPMRSGSVFMVFERMMLPSAPAQAVSANVTAADSDAVKTNAEGQLRPTVSKKRLVFQLGGTALAAKLSDDLSEAIGGTAISASTARYAGMAGAATFFLLQKGREVKLKPGDKLEIEFGR